MDKKKDMRNRTYRNIREKGQKTKKKYTLTTAYCSLHCEISHSTLKSTNW